MSTFEGLQAGTYTIDPAHTEAGFVARHAMVAKVRGRFSEVSGTITVAENIEDSTVHAVLKTASVDTGNADRNAHLRSADFFDVENNPEITFVSTAVRVTGDNEAVIVGDLTIGGVTKPVELEAEYEGTAQDPFGNVRAGFSASTEVEREEWGLTWNAALETGGVLVSKKIKLQLEVSAIRG